jgi:Fur family transcriptional regulator, ferric uptake regulator
MNESIHWMTTLEKNGCRITAPRKAIVELLTSSQRALEPMEIFDLIRVNQHNIGLVTVYRTLEKLESLGLIQRVHQDDGCHMVMKALPGHQHYLVCNHCGVTTLFEGDDLEGLIEGVEKSTGFQVQDHWLQFMGTCPACQDHSHD